MFQRITIVATLALGHYFVAAFHPGPASFGYRQSSNTRLRMSETKDISLGENCVIVVLDVQYQQHHFCIIVYA